jgi:hypothetical protein
MALLVFPVPKNNNLTGDGYVFTLNASYDLVYDSKFNHLISFYPSLVYSFMGFIGYDIGIIPMFNINKIMFDRCRFKIEIYGLIFSFGLFDDLIFYPEFANNVCITIGFGLPPFMNLFHFTDVVSDDDSKTNIKHAFNTTSNSK